MKADIVVVGAGPAGLCFARSLAGTGLKVVVVDQQGTDEIRNPEFDGREIALTHKSVGILKRLGLWDRIESPSKSRLLDARIYNGKSSYALEIGRELSPHDELGWLVSNHHIRKAAFEAVQCAREDGVDIEILASERVVGVKSDDDCASVELESGQSIATRLIVAADSRFSATRRMMGISAQMRDFGKTMLVCGMTHEQPHHHAAWEWFGYGQTLALLPMNPHPESGAFRSSVVLTLTGREIERLKQVDARTFADEIERRFDHRLGSMELVTTRHAYPLVAVYPERFVAKRFAAVGDAAVGMHPVTAHGFNFGLSGVDSLSGSIREACLAGRDYASDALLRRYEHKHRLTTRPLYLLTGMIASIYTRDHLPARLARDVLLRAGEHLRPFKRGVAAYLAGGL
ncbi:5-demethoxyubiquinol-8 5-hydroxylase UbiM [Paraburkholderia silviterrae]|uniref:5-demethoxyubiquinol-8 5-hydroxylase UbiM n=1 Tax=Paraburkholderia silviterrae TaxID=2528715 RepID=A0A4R5M9U0_9BURK|nr:5-demethoxyubiquinol-8 5-hydroxylase UbiM [Paraburkholderia silviterrae]TDG23383.1 5-demethoxyubiquinol-8 5-hydroxylase UbiM [Paraburkholderia silviterrae]